jgi:hypothetical protein
VQGETFKFGVSKSKVSLLSGIGIADEELEEDVIDLSPLLLEKQQCLVISKPALRVELHTLQIDKQDTQKR